MDGQAPVPTSLTEVESLIFSLYDPQTAPSTIAAIQESLQRLQRSPEGWQLAQALLDRPTRTTADDQVKFFGALTIIVKLNTESSALSAEDAGELLQNMLRWLASSAGDDVGVLSAHKICHALVTFFIHFPTLWPNCVKSLLLCLRAGRNVSQDDLDQVPGTADILAGFDWHLLRVSLWFINNLVADVGKTDMKIPRYSAVHKLLLENAADVAELLHVGLASPVSDATKYHTIRRESIKCLQSWILYAQRLPAGSEGLVLSLRSAINPVFELLQDDELYDAAAEILIDILSNYSNFFTSDNYNSMALIFESAWGGQLLDQLLGGDFDFEPLQYGLLLIAYGDAKVEVLMQSADDRSRRILSALSSLLSAKGYPVAQDLIFVPALEFWATYIETMLDTMYSDEGQYAAWVEPALALVKEVVGHCWEKAQYPPTKEFMSWDTSEKTGFVDARKDIGDLLQTVFTVAGRDLLMIFTDLLLRSISEEAWPQIEATAFCLAALSDCISDDSSYDGLLESIFSSSLFNLLALGETKLPVRLRQTALSLIERYSEYFERKSDHMPAVLNLLFEAVATPSLAVHASKAISTLCSSCRSLLTSEATAFLHQYQLLHDNPQLESFAEERIVNAIAAIIQATPDAATRLQLAEQLLSFIMRDVEFCLQSDVNHLDESAPLIIKGNRQSRVGLAPDQPASSPNDILLQAVLVPLRCLGSMARGLQSTTEHHIDLDSGDEETLAKPSAMVQSPQLQSLHSNIMAMILAIQTAFPKSSEVVDIICSILKAGFSETEPGPLVFPPDMVTEVLIQIGSQTPYIGPIVNSAHSFVSSLGKSPRSEATVKSLGTLVPWVLGLLQALPSPDADAELSQRGIEFIDRVMRKHAAVLLRIEPSSQLEFFFMFTLTVLGDTEPLPKAASADFWTTFLTLRPDDENLAATVSSAMEHLGPLLAQSLVNNIGGNALRSELDKLCEPLKKMVVRNVRAQAWLEQALMSPSFPGVRMTANDKAIFLRRLISLRGSRQTNEIAREFWLACRGSNFTYAS